MKKTGWFPPNVKPVREGVYELLNTSTGATFFSRWLVEDYTGCRARGWSRGHTHAEAAALDPWFGLVQNRWQWRGLQGDAHSLRIDASTFLVESSEGPDRPGDDE